MSVVWVLIKIGIQCSMVQAIKCGAVGSKGSRSDLKTKPT